MNIAIITGASSGLGAEYLRLLERENLDELWLIARRKDRLEALAEKLQTPCRILAYDLSQKNSLVEIAALFQALPNLQICWLVNAAGFGRIGSCEEIGASVTANLIDLNCRAAAALTQLCLPYLTPGSHVLEIASCAAFQPIPYLAAYAASKAFLLSYSRALAVELAPRKISVTAVCPYWIKDTEFIEKAKETDSQKIFRGFPFCTSREKVARRSFQAAKKGRALCTPDPVSTLHHYLTAIVPTGILVRASIWYRKITG